MEERTEETQETRKSMHMHPHLQLRVSVLLAMSHSVSSSIDTLCIISSCSLGDSAAACDAAITHIQILFYGLLLGCA